MSNLPQTNKSLGQHWLTDEHTLNEICASADLTKQDTVLEVGPGTGTLTKKLTEHAGQVVAVEFDQELAKNLIHRQIAKNLQIVSEDILQFNLTTLPKNYKVVANIPYYLTSKLVRVLSESANPAQTVVLLLQKEVAERVCAAPGKMSLLSATAQFYWETNLGIEVPAAMFTPPPKVDSQVVIMQRKQTLPDVDTKQFFQLVKAGFSARRKTLLNSLSAGLRISKEEAIGVLDDANIEPSRRAQTLSLDEWLTLYARLKA